MEISSEGSLLLGGLGFATASTFAPTKIYSTELTRKWEMLQTVGWRMANYRGNFSNDILQVWSSLRSAMVADPYRDKMEDSPDVFLLTLNGKTENGLDYVTTVYATGIEQAGVLSTVTHIENTDGTRDVLGFFIELPVGVEDGWIRVVKRFNSNAPRIDPAEKDAFQSQVISIDTDKLSSEIGKCLKFIGDAVNWRRSEHAFPAML